MSWYLIVVCICICLISDIRHFFMYLLTIWRCAFETFILFLCLKQTTTTKGKLVCMLCLSPTRDPVLGALPSALTVTSWGSCKRAAHLWGPCCSTSGRLLQGGAQACDGCSSQINFCKRLISVCPQESYCKFNLWLSLCVDKVLRSVLWSSSMLEKFGIVAYARWFYFKSSLFRQS